MTYKLIAGHRRPRKAIHALCLIDDLMDTKGLDEPAGGMRERAQAKSGGQNAAVVLV